MKLSDIGEFRLIQEHILPALGRAASLGDDCGWMDLGDGRVLLASTDAMVEESDYQKRWMSGEELARKALRTALGDIAAMGGAESLGCTVALAWTKNTELSRHESFMKGLKKEAQLCQAVILGGDLTEAQEREFVNVTVFGIARTNRLLKRSQARAGETLWLTGPVGFSAAGLEVLMRGSQALYPKLARAHKLPSLRMKEANLLSFRDISRCAIDTSDNLAASLLWLARSSHKVDFEVNLRQMPVPRELELWSRHARQSPQKYLLYGGEDYELLFTSWCSHRVILRYLPDAFPVGRVVAGRGRVRVLDVEGMEWFLDETQIGYQAFKK